MIAVVRGMGWQALAIATMLLAFMAAQSDLTALTAALAAVAGTALLVAFGGRASVMAIARVASGVPAIRDRRHRSVFIPQCDPGAAGRPKPRAPGC